MKKAGNLSEYGRKNRRTEMLNNGLKNGVTHSRSKDGDEDVMMEERTDLGKDGAGGWDRGEDGGTDTSSVSSTTVRRYGANRVNDFVHFSPNVPIFHSFCPITPYKFLLLFPRGSITFYMLYAISHIFFCFLRERASNIGGRSHKE